METPDSAAAAPAARPVEPIELDEDPGLVPVSLCGKKFLVSPLEELHNLRIEFSQVGIEKFPKDQQNDRRVLAVRDYLEKKHSIKASPDMAAKYYVKLQEANKQLESFFGWTQSSPTTSTSTQEDSAAEPSEPTSPTSTESTPPSP